MSYSKQTWTNNVSIVDENRMNHIEDGIYQNSTDIELLQNKDRNLENEIFYKSGDTYSAGYISLSGHVTTGTTGVAITLFLPKRLDNITSITINTLKMEARGIKGYLNSNAGSYDFLNDSNYTVNVTKRASNAIAIFIKKSSAFTNVDNNTPVNFTGEISLTFN